MTGPEAESLAARHLEASGYRIVARNVKSKLGELDIVARDRSVLCFVEVRLRRDGRAAESIDPSKRRRLTRAAEHYLVSHGLSRTPCRFDVVAIAADGAPVLIRDAF